MESFFKSVLVVSDDVQVEQAIKGCSRSDFRFYSAFNKSNALERLREERLDFVFIDINILIDNKRKDSYKKALDQLKNLCPTIQIVVMSSDIDVQYAIQAINAGASDYLTYPIISEEVRLLFDKISTSVTQQAELDYLRDKFWKTDFLEVAQTVNPAMKEVFNKVQAVAPTKTTVLLMGETGTGKGVLAKLLHNKSNRENAQFISVHCGAIPDTLLESELFGHEKGAFTGAVRKKLGKFEIARKGTIFLDEIATVTPSAQVKLLQVLQDGCFSRVGGEEILATDARVVAASNSDLKQMVDKGEFRKDLFFRLNVFPIEIPPLRERIEDIPVFVRFFIKKFNKEFQKDIKEIHWDALEALKQYSWPGNIRELENLMERAYILETSSMLTPESFPNELFEGQSATAVLPINSTTTLAEARRKALEDFERQYLKDLLSRHNGRIKKSAEEAGIGTRQLHKLMSRYGIRKEDFKP
jgi:DNA-binding NtrC family response regulator